MSKFNQAPDHVLLQALELSELFREIEVDDYKESVTTFQGYTSRAEATRYINEEFEAFKHTERFVLGE